MSENTDLLQCPDCTTVGKWRRRPDGRTGCANCGWYDILERSGLDMALARWRAIGDERRTAIMDAMRSDRERLAEQSSNYVRAEDIKERDEVLACCDAAEALLREASVRA